MDKVASEPLHEFWYEYTAQEISNIKRKKCLQCPYKGTISSCHDGMGTGVCCDYILITGESRGVRPELCEHFKDLGVERENAFTSQPPTRRVLYGVG